MISPAGEVSDLPMSRSKDPRGRTCSTVQSRLIRLPTDGGGAGGRPDGAEVSWHPS